MRTVLLAVLLLIAPPVGAVPTIGSGFGRLVAFGDSLTDVGNVDQATGGFAPGPEYFEGRFSNGPVYAEVLADGLGVGPLGNSLSGGDVWAYGGARTTGTPFPASLVVRDLDDQVNAFLNGGGSGGEGDLFLVYAGGNDVAAVVDGGSNGVTAAAGRVVSQMGRLFDAGARDFLVPNLPPLGLTPRYNGDPADAALADALTLDFNAALADALDAFDAARPAADARRLDVAGLFAGLVADPSAFGFDNVTDPALGTAGADPEAYLFWDDFHPTAAAHRLLGRAALAAVPHPLQERPRGNDFQRPAPRVNGPGGAFAAAVPEPSAAGLLILAAGLACRRRHC